MKNFTSGKEYANINKVNALLTQLVECLLDVEKVSGSSPLQRTNNSKNPLSHDKGFLLFVRRNGPCEPLKAVRKNTPKNVPFFGDPVYRFAVNLMSTDKT